MSSTHRVDCTFDALTVADDVGELVTIGDVSKRTSRPNHPELVPTKYCEFPAYCMTTKADILSN